VTWMDGSGGAEGGALAAHMDVQAEEWLCKLNNGCTTRGVARGKGALSGAVAPLPS
jgi:hypothetical protein